MFSELLFSLIAEICLEIIFFFFFFNQEGSFLSVLMSCISFF